MKYRGIKYLRMNFNTFLSFQEYNEGLLGDRHHPTDIKKNYYVYSMNTNKKTKNDWQFICFLLSSHLKWGHNPYKGEEITYRDFITNDKKITCQEFNEYISAVINTYGFKVFTKWRRRKMKIKDTSVSYDIGENKSECKTEDCENYGSSKNNGLCSVCHRLNNVRNEINEAKKTVRENGGDVSLSYCKHIILLSEKCEGCGRG